jgi:membrane fusion protein (multidrug efflux system)
MMPMSKISSFISLILLCAVNPAFAQEGPKVVEAITVKPTVISKSVKLIGQVKAKKEAHLTSAITGIVEGVVAKEGSQVTKGTLLAYLRNEDLKRASQAADANARLLQNQFARDKKLFDDGIISKDAMQRAESAWSSARMAASNARILLDQSEFRAPFDGTVGVFRVSAGSFVKSGDEIVALVDPKELEIEFSVPQKLISNLKVGDDVIVMKGSGKVLSLQRAIDPTTQMGLARAAIAKCENCLVGAYVDVGVVVERKDNAIGIPQEAIFIKDGVQQVYVVKNGKAALTSVTIGLRGDSLVEITKGVVAGDIVVTRGRNKLDEGSEVKVSP